ADLHRERRRIANLVRRFLTAPEHFAGLLVERGEEALFAAGNADQLVAIDERRRSESPADWRGVFEAAADGIDGAAEIARQVDAPQFLAGRGLATKQVAEAAESVDAVAVHGRRHIGPGVPRIAFPGEERADFGRPELLRLAVGRLEIEGDEEFIGSAAASGVEAVADDGRAGIADAEIGTRPQQFRAVSGPLLQQAG